MLMEDAALMMEMEEWAVTVQIELSVAIGEDPISGARWREL